MRHHSIRRGACVIIEDANGNLLLHHRCSRAWIYPDYLAFFGGGVEHGEDPHRALTREMQEELGFLIVGHRLFNVAWHRKPGNLTVLDYTYIWRWRPRRCRLREGQDLRWMTIDEALALPETKLPPHERSDLTMLRAKRRVYDRTALAA